MKIIHTMLIAVLVLLCSVYSTTSYANHDDGSFRIIFDDSHQYVDGSKESISLFDYQRSLRIMLLEDDLKIDNKGDYFITNDGYNSYKPNTELSTLKSYYKNNGWFISIAHMLIGLLTIVALGFAGWNGYKDEFSYMCPLTRDGIVYEVECEIVGVAPVAGVVIP